MCLSVPPISVTQSELLTASERKDSPQVWFQIVPYSNAIQRFTSELTVKGMQNPTDTTHRLVSSAKLANILLLLVIESVVLRCDHHNNKHLKLMYRTRTSWQKTSSNLRF